MDEGAFWIIFVAGIFIGAIFVATLLHTFNIVLSEETAKDICKNLTNVSEIEVDDPDFKLKCIIPNYDSTTNIIIKGVDEE